jgi:hypothetical protein
MRKQLSAICLNLVSNFELNLTSKKKNHLSLYAPKDIDRILNSSDLNCQKSPSFLDVLIIIIIIIYEEPSDNF